MVFKKFKREFPPKIYQGEWTCADCGAKITELPFQLSPDRPVYCKECHQKRRAQFRR